MELLRMSIVYVHLIACCVAIGLVLTSDVAMVRRLFSRGTRTHDPAELETLQQTVLVSLCALWVSGVALVTLDAALQGLGSFGNPKLQAKILIVSLLTLNGALLHAKVLPALQQARSLLELPLATRVLACAAGAMSGVSWFYAALLGIGRPLSWKYSLLQLLAAYPVLVIGGAACMLLVTFIAKYRRLLALVATLPGVRPLRAYDVMRPVGAG